jgi:hypothetical protein
VTPRWRRSLIALAAIGSGVAVLAPGSYQTAETVGPIERAHAAAGASSAIELPSRRLLGRQRGDLFRSQSWEPPAPPPPPPQVEQEAAPVPPPNPYRFAGTVQYGGVRKVLLTRGGDRVFEAQVGEVLEPGFRVQAVGADAVTLLYEPMNAPVSVALR